SKRTKGLEEKEEEEEEEEEEAGWGGGWRRWRRPAAAVEEAAGAGGEGGAPCVLPLAPKPAGFGVLGWEGQNLGGIDRDRLGSTFIGSDRRRIDRLCPDKGRSGGLSSNSNLNRPDRRNRAGIDRSRELDI
ncbi:hypothetical protein Taro_011123, partial [Colocasia esculenta]|nr:hypothetical protein [Colocasia esculenta]